MWTTTIPPLTDYFPVRPPPPPPYPTDQHTLPFTLFPADKKDGTGAHQEEGEEG